MMGNMPAQEFRIIKATIAEFEATPVKAVTIRSRPAASPIRRFNPATRQVESTEDPVKKIDPVRMRFRQQESAGFIRAASDILGSRRLDDVLLLTDDGQTLKAGVQSISGLDPVEIEFTPEMPR